MMEIDKFGELIWNRKFTEKKIVSVIDPIIAILVDHNGLQPTTE